MRSNVIICEWAKMTLLLSVNLFTQKYCTNVEKLRNHQVIPINGKMLCFSILEIIYREVTELR